jgi:TatD DNase family protein
MDLFDSHCHLDDDAFAGDIEAVVERARAGGVAHIMTVGVTRHTSTAAVTLAQRFAGVWAAVGIHPHDAKDCSEETLEALLQLAREPKVRAWGEIGLDFNRMFSPPQEQEKWFIRQLHVSAACDLPVIFHERDTQGRFLDLLRAHFRPGRTGVVHCFSGSESERDAYLDRGLYIGITGIVTLKQRGSRLRRLAAQIPQDRLLIETDAPYLVPAPERNRTRRNEPAFVRSVLMRLAEIRQENPDHLARMCSQNAARLFRIAAPPASLPTP